MTIRYVMLLKELHESSCSCHNDEVLLFRIWSYVLSLPHTLLKRV